MLTPFDDQFRPGSAYGRDMGQPRPMLRAGASAIPSLVTPINAHGLTYNDRSQNSNTLCEERVLRGQQRHCILHKRIARFVSDSWVSCIYLRHHFPHMMNGYSTVFVRPFFTFRVNPCNISLQPLQPICVLPSWISAYAYPLPVVLATKHAVQPWVGRSLPPVSV